jgi:beta-N-acetylhexosaminidase
MAALTGTMGDRTRAVLAAGCDLALHCSGEIGEGEAVVEAAGEITLDARARLDRAMASGAGAGPGGALDALAAKRDALLAYAPAGG